MKYIKQVITILGISTLLGAIPATVYAQAPLPRIQRIPVDKTSLQQFYNQGVQKLAQGNFNGAIEDFDGSIHFWQKYLNSQGKYI
jgi:outer membrane protein assembly factor BamD (BamD/ComL family)